MSRFGLTINGRDFSSAVNKWGMGYQQIKVTGLNDGVSMGGSSIVDLVKVKDMLSFVGNAVDQDTFSALDTLCRQAYVTASYVHPATGTTVQKEMIPTLSAANRIPMAGGRVWFTDWTLVLEER